MAFGIPLVVACAGLLAGAVCQAEHLPIRVFSGADGLASSSVGCIVRDSRDFLWFCTAEGLSRFDGYTFANYGTAQGLPSGGAFDFLETHDGEYWVATADAISRFNPEGSKIGGSLFEVHPINYARAASQPCQMAEAPDGGIWCLTSEGLLRFDRRGRQFERIDLDRKLEWTCLFQDRDDSLWLGTLEGPLVHRWADGRVETLGGVEGLPVRNGRTSAIFRDRAGRLWVATWDGLYLLRAHPTAGRRAVERIYSQRDGLAGKVVFDVFQSRSGKLWVGLEKGLSELVPGGAGKPERFRSYSARKGFDMAGIEGPAVDNFAEDASGNLWFSGTGPPPAWRPADLLPTPLRTGSKAIRFKPLWRTARGV
jgi:ligand-binding sensor domain-containing protein